jgi:hypothetical protein
VLFVGQLGKYLSGSVWPVLVQIELAAEHKIPRARTAAASVINMCLSLLCALIVALLTLPFTRGFSSACTSVNSASIRCLRFRWEARN